MPGLNVPLPEETQKELDPLFPLIHTALEHGTLNAREFFDRENGGKVNRYLAPDLVRFWAKMHLEKAGLSVSTEEQAEFDLKNIPNNGLCLSYGKYRLRILKSDNGDPPVPGHSVSRQDFYHQISIVFTTEDGAEVQEEAVNLLILWDVAAPYNLTGLSLVCPKSGKDTKASVQVHWHVPIKHPAFAFTMDAEAQPTTEEDNLPLKLKQIDKKTEGAG